MTKGNIFAGLTMVASLWAAAPAGATGTVQGLCPPVAAKGATAAAYCGKPSARPTGRLVLRLDAPVAQRTPRSPVDAVAMQELGRRQLNALIASLD